MNRIDLHIHSIFSNDGTYAPEELVRMCGEAGIRVMAVADHNSVKACLPAMEAAKEAGITCVPALEIDCTYRAPSGQKGTDLHVLGYGIDPLYPGLARLEEELAEQERASSRPRLEIMKEMGLKIDEEKAYGLAHYGYVTGEVIAETALADPRNDGHPMLEPYRPGGSRSDNPYVNFYWDWCAPDKPAYVPIAFISLEECLELIHSAGGTPVLAHPGNNVKEDGALLDEILSCGVRGIEVYSTYHSREQEDYYRKKADEHSLLITCGSDYHGKTKPSIFLGKMELREDEERILAGMKGLGYVQ